MTARSDGTKFISAVDESEKNGLFVYGGFSASRSFWEKDFAPAWTEFVLDTPPRLTHLHVADLYRPEWRASQGMSETQMRRKLDEAARVIRSSGQLLPVVFSLTREEFDLILRQQVTFYPDRKQPQEKSLDPDYICFYLCALEQLQRIKNEYPSTERVDFWVEENRPITSHMLPFKNDLHTHLPSLGLGHLVPLVGKYTSVTKDRIPVQAADYLCWHERHQLAGTLGREEARRYWHIIDGGVFRRATQSQGSRTGYKYEIKADLLGSIAGALAKRVAEASS